MTQLLNPNCPKFTFLSIPKKMILYIFSLIIFDHKIFSISESHQVLKIRSQYFSRFRKNVVKNSFFASMISFMVFENSASCPYDILESALKILWNEKIRKCKQYSPQRGTRQTFYGLNLTKIDDLRFLGNFIISLINYNMQFNRLIFVQIN